MSEYLSSADYPNTLVVGWPDWKRAEGDQVLETYNAWPCAEVAFWAEGVGYMGHFPSPATADKTAFEAMIDCIRSEVRDVTKLHAWVQGCCLTGLNDHDVLANRVFVEERIAALGVPDEQVEIAWLEPDDFYAHMRLRCKTGQFQSAKNIFSNEFLP